MNAFRILGDLMHLLSAVLLLWKIWRTRSCRGVSLKTQELYALVYVTRYINIFDVYYAYQLDMYSYYDYFYDADLYNTVMKLGFLGLSGAICNYIRADPVVKTTYDRKLDTVRRVFLVAPAAILALLIKQDWSPYEVQWTFSIYLEAVALLPQLVMLQRTQDMDNITYTSIFLLGTYRGLYVLNWVFRYITESYYNQWRVWVSGMLQTVLFAAGATLACMRSHHMPEAVRDDPGAAGAAPPSSDADELLLQSGTADRTSIP